MKLPFEVPEQEVKGQAAPEAQYQGPHDDGPYKSGNEEFTIFTQTLEELFNIAKEGQEDHEAWMVEAS